ncbi:MAG: SpoIIE family protein phosphatase [Halioglobus sp.]
MTKSITSKLILLLTLCLAVILSIGMAIDYRLSRDEILSRLQLESIDTVNAVVTDLENWLDSVEGATQFLGRVLEQREYTPAGLKQMLKDLVENNDDIYGAAIALSPDVTDHPMGFAPYYYRKNNSLEFVDIASKQEKYWQQPWYAEAVNAAKPVWVEPYFDTGGGEVLMTTFSVPIYRRDNNGQRFLYGVVTADITLEELHQYLQRLRLGKSGFGILLSRAGIILSARDPEIIMHHHLEAAEGALDVAAWKKLVSGVQNGQVMSSQIDCPDILGSCMIRLSALQPTGWPVGVIYAEDEILAPLRDYQIRTALLGLVTLLVMVAVVSLVSRRLTRPLTALAQVTDQIAQGKLDVPLPRIQGEDEVARLIRAFAAMKENLRTYIDDLESATAARSRLVGELAAAREIQMAMLPQGGQALEQSATFALWATVRPAKTVGGDLYTYYCDDNNRLFITVGDVSDKGVPAALFMAKTISHIQQYSTAFTVPATGMALLNNALEAGNSNCMFVTLFFGVLDLNSGLLQFASAGHTPPSLVRGGEATPVDQLSGPALGLAANLEFPTNSLQLRPGDRLAIYTDGIDEAFNEQAQMFSSERFDRALESSIKDTPTEAGVHILQLVDDFAGTTAQSDDITLMLIDVLALPAVAARDKIHSSFEPGPLLTSRVGNWLQDELRKFDLDNVLIMELMLVSEEVATNIAKYAELPADGEIILSIARSDTDVLLEFADPGMPFDPLQDSLGANLGADIESAEIGGLGVHLIRELTDEQRYQRLDGHNILRLSKTLSSAG